jgi:hypothetical protein
MERVTKGAVDAFHMLSIHEHDETLLHKNAGLVKRQLLSCWETVEWNQFRRK